WPEQRWLFINRLKPSAPAAFLTAAATFWVAWARWAARSGGRSTQVSWWSLGRTRTWPQLMGLMSRIAKQRASSKTFCEGISPSRIRQNTQSPAMSASLKKTKPAVPRGRRGPVAVGPSDYFWAGFLGSAFFSALAFFSLAGAFFSAAGAAPPPGAAGDGADFTRPAERSSSSRSFRTTSSQIAFLPLSPSRLNAYCPRPSPSHREPPSFTTRV